MLGAAVIVFREVLEAALIIGIIAAATRGLNGRGRWLFAGVGFGVAGAILIAGLAGKIAGAAEGIGQELLNATILGGAVMMLAWHNVWMSRHARALVSNMHSVGASVNEGTRPLSVVALVVGLAVLREGAEVVLFLYGITIGGVSTMPMLGGSMLGLTAGAAIGFALYVGLLSIPMRHLFTVTGWMILLLAGGMAAQAAQFLVQADFLPELAPALWDTSLILDERSIPGQLLHTLIGYVARPSGTQVLTYTATIGIIGVLMLILGNKPQTPHPKA